MNTVSNGYSSCGAANCTVAAGPRVRDAGMAFVHCETCGVLRIPSENLVSYAVPPDPRGNLSLVMQTLMTMRMLWLRAVIPALRDRSVAILDVGCGDGQFLEFLGRNGYRNVRGTEPDDLRRANARARGLAVFSTLPDATSPDEKPVGILTIWHVLEHVTRPVAFLRECAQGLGPSGLAILSVPNQSSWQTRLFGIYSSYPDYGRHVWYHSPSYIAPLQAEIPELRFERVRDFNFEYEIFSWIDSAISFAFQRPNVAHRSLKKGEGSSASRLGIAVISIILLPLATVMACASLSAGRGSTLTIIARRPNG